MTCNDFNEPSAYDQVINGEARALYLSASILGNNLQERREILEHIVDLALKQLYAK